MYKSSFDSINSINLMNSMNSNLEIFVNKTFPQKEFAKYDGGYVSSVGVCVCMKSMHAMQNKNIRSIHINLVRTFCVQDSNVDPLTSCLIQISMAKK